MQLWCVSHLDPEKLSILRKNYRRIPYNRGLSTRKSPKLDYIYADYSRGKAVSVAIYIPRSSKVIDIVHLLFHLFLFSL
jgi:hypothetical protein